MKQICIRDTFTVFVHVESAAVSNFKGILAWDGFHPIQNDEETFEVFILVKFKI